MTYVSPRAVMLMPLLAWVAAASAQTLPTASPPSAPPFVATAGGISTFAHISGRYGTLAFQGLVQRVDLGERYEFRVLLAATFLPDERTNRVEFADIRYVEVRAMDRPPVVLQRVAGFTSGGRWLKRRRASV